MIALALSQCESYIACVTTTTTQTERVRQHGPAIRALRRKDGLSVKTLADRIGLHAQSLRNIELDRRPASWETLNAIARALRVDVAAVSAVVDPETE